MRHRWLVFALIVAALAVVAAGCGGGDDNGGSSAEGSEDVTGDISAMAIWGGEEQASFQAVIDGFNELYPTSTSSTRRAATTSPPCCRPRSRAGTRPTSPASASPVS